MKKVLVIEDESWIQAAIVDLLELSGFQVFSADDGEDGVVMTLQHQPDLILCDVIMPGMDGYAVLTQVRSHPQTATTPFIFLTAKADRCDRRQGMDLGADDYLTKPFLPEELLKAIATRLEKQDLIHRNQQAKLDELRTNIAHSLPHEFRTPLNSILGFSELLLRHPEDLEKTEIHEMADGIHRAGQRLFRLIQNFLLYADLELVASKPETIEGWRQQKTPYSRIIINNASLQQAKAAKREADLSMDLTDASVRISATSLQKIVEELINNAFKFSAVGTPVKIVSEIEQSCFKLSILDYGRGMSSAQIADLGAYMQFERRHYEQQGSGLGLAIAKRLVELHGGQLTIDSIPHQQTLVQVLLPIELFSAKGDRVLAP